MTYNKVFKCRLCGQKFSNGVVCGDVADVTAEIFREMMGKPMQFTTHECFGGFGLADFQGYEVENGQD